MQPSDLIIVHPPILVIVIAGSQHADAQHCKYEYGECQEYDDCDFRHNQASFGDLTLMLIAKFNQLNPIRQSRL
jgi:hypothetical protein